MRYWRQFMGTQSNGDATLAALSPARLASKADAPILVMYGLDDTVVPLEQSREMVASLRAAGKPVEVMELPGEDHWLSKPATRTQFILTTVAFVEKYNPPN
jgi:dipeptidyl aminopeptidase/acylaminoacyl peptidase